MSKIKKSDIDIDTMLVKLTFVMKGNRQVIEIHTTAKEACDFVDILNKNKVIYSRKEKEKFSNKFYTFDDYIKKESVCINLQEIKCFTIPFYIETEKEYDFKILQTQ